MSKKKSSFDDPLNGASFEDIKKLLFAHARRGVTTTEYPYVDGHATLQIDDVEPKAYHLYISLIDSPVEIYRRITVPSNLRLEHLAEIVVRVMGWTNTHLHQFIIHGDYFVCPEELKEDTSMFPHADAMACSVGDVLQDKGDTIKFEYVSVDSGKGDRPPEDVGGVYGYADFLARAFRREGY